MAAHQCQINDGALAILDGMTCPTEHGNKCELNWRLEATLLNIPGQRYTLGKDFNSWQGRDDEGDQWISLPNRTGIGKVQAQIVCEVGGTFMLHPLGYCEIFANGVLVSAPIRLKFGDIFYFSHKLSQFWNPHLNPGSAPGLTTKEQNGVAPLVFKFQRLISKNKCKPSNHRLSKVPPPTTTVDGDGTTSPFLKTGPSPPTTWMDNDVILSKIFGHLLPQPEDTYSDLFSCRRVSKSWNRASSSILKSNFVPRFTIIADDVLLQPNKIGSDLHWAGIRMQLKFDSWKIDMWPAGGGEVVRDNPARDGVVARFNNDMSNYLRCDNHPVKRLDLNIDYLFPINELLSKFKGSLEVFKFQVNMLWIGDEKTNPFPSDIPNFPRLTNVNLWFSFNTSEEVGMMRDSSWLKSFLSAISTSCETMEIKNYARIPVDFSSFTKLRNLTLVGECGYGIWEYRLQAVLDSLITLPPGQLTSFKLIMKDIDLFEEKVNVEEALLRFLERQKTSLKRLELIFSQGAVTPRIPRSFSVLERLWISTDIYWEGKDAIWGVKLQEQVARLGTGFGVDFDITMLPLLAWGKGRVTGGGSKLELAFGRWDLVRREFVCYIPNVDNMWAWDT